MGRTAMEMQIPKKPMYEGYCCDGSGRLIYDTWICPNCGERYGVDYDDYDICTNWQDSNGNADTKETDV